LIELPHRVLRVERQMSFVGSEGDDAL